MNGMLGMEAENPDCTESHGSDQRTVIAFNRSRAFEMFLLNLGC
jgi:hypothetical protein